jgi:hypothetical protein
VLLLHGFGASTTWQWAPYLHSLLVAGLDPIVASLSTVPDHSDAFQERTVKATTLGLFPIADVGEAAELLIPWHSTKVCWLVDDVSGDGLKGWPISTLFMLLLSVLDVCKLSSIICCLFHQLVTSI